MKVVWDLVRASRLGCTVLERQNASPPCIITPLSLPPSVECGVLRSLAAVLNALCRGIEDHRFKAPTYVCVRQMSVDKQQEQHGIHLHRSLASKQCYSLLREAHKEAHNANGPDHATARAVKGYCQQVASAAQVQPAIPCMADQSHGGSCTSAAWHAHMAWRGGLAASMKG